MLEGRTIDIQPVQLDGADVLCWVVSQRGNFYTQVGSDPPIVVVAMAVARYPDGGPYYLFKCDRDWEVVGDWDCESIAEAQELAVRHAGGEQLVWQPYSGLDAATYDDK